MRYNLGKEDEARIISLAKKYRVEKVILFGSRARGDNRPDSDVDLALSGGNYLEFAFDFDDETNGNVKCDVTYLDHEIELDLRNAINEEGIVLYEDKIDYERRYQLFSEALNNFERFVELAKQYPDNDSFVLLEVSKVFGACFKQSWKLLKLLLESYGESFDKNVAPSVVLEVACRCGIIEDSLSWRELLDSYNDCGDVKTEYLKMFHDLKCRVDTMNSDEQRHSVIDSCGRVGRQIYSASDSCRARNYRIEYQVTL